MVIIKKNCFQVVIRLCQTTHSGNIITQNPPDATLRRLNDDMKVPQNIIVLERNLLAQIKQTFH